MIIEIHALQTFGPSNLNRDDTGNPKEALFGGVRRARISSQSAKRAMRVSEIFGDEIQVTPGVRTKILTGIIAERLVEAGMPEETALEHAADVMGSVFAKPDSKNKAKTSVLVYISNDELNLLVNYILDVYQQDQAVDFKSLSKDITKQLKNRSLAPDIALFGRMLAEHPDLNTDAASEMMHALSTHEVNTAEFDYFTAVDDLTPDETSGAGMLGLVAFNSATYYRNARIHWEQLVQNLHGDVDLATRTVSGFMKAFALVVPSGMKNTFVNQHAPDFLLAVIRPKNDGQSLVNAFEKPIRAKRGEGGFAELSAHALAEYWEQVDVAFRLHQPILSVMNPRGYQLPSNEIMSAVQPNLQAWVDGIASQLSEDAQ
jgi:CRISPR system Cascade subunit CasC